jgi:uncharacterized membrane protein (UPF0136 family)
MKTKYGFLFSVLLLGGALSSSAQQTSNPAVVSGHFEIDTAIASVMQHVNVNYTLSPAPFTSVAHLLLNSAEPRVFNVDLVSATGTVLMSWTPTVLSHQYEHDFNISSLPAGSYEMRIRKYHTTEVLHTVSFSK